MPRSSSYKFIKKLSTTFFQVDTGSASSGCDHATALLKSVPSMTQRIAGKSLPIEKFAVRKVKRFLAQGNRLILPGYELMYVWNGFSVLGENRFMTSPVVALTSRLASCTLQHQSLRAI